MEANLIYRIVGNYSITQAEPGDQCRICNDVDCGEMLVQRLNDDGYVCVKCLLIEHELKQPINIIFDGSPSPESGRFVEVETNDGKSINAGEWIKQKDGYWALRIVKLPSEA